MKRCCLVLLLAASCLAAGAKPWELKPWQAYLIELRVKADTTTSTRSIMLSHLWKKSQLRKPHFNFPHYDAPEPQSVFAWWDEQVENERIAREGYHTRDFVADMLCNALELIFYK